MMWSTEVAHECGHVVTGLLMGGELLNTSADLEYGAGNTRFHFPQGLKTSADLDRLTFLDGLYDLAGIGGGVGTFR
jgi:hypothetical protein